MAYEFAIRERAFEMYCQGLSLQSIAEALGINRYSTLSQWKKKDNWDARRIEIQQKAQAAVNDKIAVDMEARLVEHDKMGRILRGLAAAKLRVIQERTQPTVDSEGNVIPGVAPDGLELMRLASATSKAIQLERQAIGLDTLEAPLSVPGGVNEAKAPIPITIIGSDLDLIKELSLVEDNDNGNGNGDGKR